MAHKKGVGSTDNGRDSNSKRLGVKLFGGQTAVAGNIIIRQRGTKFHAGEHVGLGKDYTIYALQDGTVRFHRGRKNRMYVSIDPFENPYADFTAPTLDKKKKHDPKKVEEAAKEIEEQLDNAAESSEEKTEDQSAENTAATEEKEEESSSSDEAEQIDPQQIKESLHASIGEASADQKDDLKKISGVGPKLEETLNALGIYTYEQVSKMGDKEYDLIDAMLGSFKGRGQRDEWHNQAKELMK